ncbi:hypothetical protein IMZ48_17595 [Candidatus Bathyarchaeota archaeon]|nr:hypothetical protein [Candidatus Bathyarchaeota archaeon]
MTARSRLRRGSGNVVVMVSVLGKPNQASTHPGAKQPSNQRVLNTAFVLADFGPAEKFERATWGTTKGEVV